MKIATADSVCLFARILTYGRGGLRRMRPHRGVEVWVCNGEVVNPFHRRAAPPALTVEAPAEMPTAIVKEDAPTELAAEPQAWSVAEQHAIEEVLLHARSASTRRAYHADWRAFAAWCAQRQVTSLPVDLTNLSLYLRSMHDNDKRIATIERALVAISVAHERSGHPSPRQTMAIREMMRGLRRMKRDVVVKHAPALTLAHLQKLIDANMGDSSIDLRSRALLLIGFFGAMRRSEIVGLHRSDIKETEEGLVVKIRRSKTDQEGKGHIIGIRRQRNAAYCPVLAYAAWLAAHPGGEFAFVALGPGRVGDGMTPQSVRLILESMAKRARISVDYSPHSLRAGFATAAAKAGIADRAIMRQTRHKSVQMLSRYVQEGSAFIAGVDALL